MTSMSNICRITDPADQRISMFVSMSDAQLRSRIDAENAILIAESPKVITVALNAGYRPVALMCEDRHLDNDAADIVARIGDVPIYTGSRDVLAAITGYTLTRGVLCAMQRPPRPAIGELLTPDTSRIAVIDGVCDTTNIGAIFRAAAALGIDAVLLTRTSCDPFNRRSIRVSMGSVFLVKWGWLDEPLHTLHHYGFKTLAMALKPHSLPLDDPRLSAEDKLAIVLGTEGDGLADNTIADADYSVIIPMHHGVDSLNVASAAAVTFWQLRKQNKITT